MLLHTILKYLWSGNRSALISYCLVSITVPAVFLFGSKNLSEDFNPLGLIGFLNIVFLLSSPFLCRQVLYKTYQDGTHDFFAPLPIPRLRVRALEHLSYFLIGVLPYVVVVPVLLFLVYYNGLWSSNQVLNFLCFQFFFWLVYANYSLFLAMSGRLCWYLFWSVLIGVSLYIHYNKNYQFGFLGFIKVNQVLYKTQPLTQDLLLGYGTLCVLFYAIALGSSFLIERNRFSLLYAKETALSRGIFCLYLVIATLGYFYYSHELYRTKSEFSGLYLTEINVQSGNHWSSSVELDEEKFTRYETNIVRLDHELWRFSKAYQLAFPAVHYQHNPEQERIKPLRDYQNADSDLELEFNFEKLNERFLEAERDVIIEALRYYSRGWLEKEESLVFVRGLAADWTSQNLDGSLIRKRLRALTNYPDFDRQYQNGDWLSMLQDSGACLFDSLAVSLVRDIAASVPKRDVLDFMQTRLNLDHSWLPYHLIRSLLQPISELEERVASMNLPTLAQTPKDSDAAASFVLLNFQVDSVEMFPNVFQPVYRINNLSNQHTDLRVHFFEHTVPGRQVDLQSMRTDALTEGHNGEHSSEHVLLGQDRFSVGFSWYSPDLNCRVNAPWRYVEL